MTHDLIDERLLGALHVSARRRAGARADPRQAHVAYQAGTLDALMNGHYDGDATIGELLAHGNLGIGTIQHLGGELVIVHGAGWLVDGNGDVRQVAADEKTPFCVVVDFQPQITIELTEPMSLSQIEDRIESICGTDEIAAVRIDGTFSTVLVRSVAAQRRPYPPLVEVTRHQSEFQLDEVAGSIVGVRFPDRAAGLDVPGFHLHFIDDRRTGGGHLLSATLVSGSLLIDTSTELHVELPRGCSISEPASSDRRAISEAEGPQQT